MPKKIINQIEREEPLEAESQEPDIVAKVEPVRKKRQMSEEQRAKQAENLRKGREAMMLKRESKIKEQAKMLHDTVVEVKQKVTPKKNNKMEQLIKAVQSISNEDANSEPEDEVVVIKKQRKSRKIVVVEESDEETPPPPPPSTPAPKPKRQYNKKPKQPVEVSTSEPEPVSQPKPSIIFY